MARQLSPDLPAVLTLLGAEPEVHDWGVDKWQEAACNARRQRLRPWLHVRSLDRQWQLPAEISQEWADAYRRAELRVLRQKVELARITRWFAAEGMTAHVLKGGAIVWRGWIDPAVRPMRDLDLLVSAEQADAAQQLLLSRGFTSSASNLPANHKHLPGLIAPETAVVVEVHTLLIDAMTPEWTLRERLFRAAAVAKSEQLPAAQGGFWVLSDTHTLLQLIVHAVLDHQFNNGPLLLIDIEALLNHGNIDWDDFWDTAKVIGAERAAQLALALATVIWPRLAIDWQGHEPKDLEARSISSAAHLMLVTPHNQTELGLLGRLARFDWSERSAILLRGLMRRSGSGPLPSQGGGAKRPANPLAAWSQRLALAGSREGRDHIKRSLDVAKWLRE